VMLISFSVGSVPSPVASSVTGEIGVVAQISFSLFFSILFSVAEEPAPVAPSEDDNNDDDDDSFLSFRPNYSKPKNSPNKVY
jgi:hypothetical protein